MKKIMALVLAAAMLTTTAFAAVNVGGVGMSTIVNPGETLRIAPDQFTGLSGISWRMSTEYFSISAKKFDKGANLVKEVKINDDKNTVDVVLNTNYELSKTNGENLVIKELSIKAKKEWKDTTGTIVIKKNQTYTYAGTSDLFVGYVIVEQPLNASPEYVDGSLVKFTEAGGVSYETAVLDTAADLYIEGRVYAGDKVFVETDTDVNKDILKAAADDADIRFYNITTNGFSTANTIQLSAEEDEFVYKVVDGKITASGLKWSADDYAWVGKIRTSVSYVVSDVELKAAPATEGATGNPDTGANDVVGIAAALAVVSLVAAGAVSLKK